MIVVHAEVFAQIPHREAVRAAMMTAQSAAREQDGCISFVFAETLDDPGHFLAVERWRDHAALDAHFATPSYSAYEATITPLLLRDSEVLVYSAEQASRPIDSSPLDLRQDD